MISWHVRILMPMAGVITCWFVVLEHEVRELRQANEILRNASAYFAQSELDRRFES